MPATSLIFDLCGGFSRLAGSAWRFVGPQGQPVVPLATAAIMSPCSVYSVDGTACVGIAHWTSTSLFDAFFFDGEESEGRGGVVNLPVAHSVSLCSLLCEIVLFLDLNG